MRLNTANRSFFTLVGAALVPYVLLGLFGCGLLSVVAVRLVREGWSGLDRDGQDLRPAVVFFAVVATGTVIAALSVWRQVRATRRLAALVEVRSVPISTSIDAAAARCQLGGRVDVLDDREPFSFTYGLWAPRVALSSGLAETVKPEELDAVLHHERYHVRNWDTVKVVVARAAPSAFFFLPALRHLRDRYLAGRELAADRQAMRAAGQQPLAGALYRVLARPTWSDFGAAAALGGSEFLDHRVEQLERGEEPPLPRLPRTAVVLTVAGLVAVVVGFGVTLAASGTSVMSMDGSMRPSGGLGVLAIIGGVVCMGAWVVAAVVIVRRVTRHRHAG